MDTARSPENSFEVDLENTKGNNPNNGIIDDPSTKRNKKFLFLLCWIAYFSTYLTRLNFSAVMPELFKDSVLSSIQMANIGSCFFITYGIGQLLSGFLGDKVSPRMMIFFGMLISALCNMFIFLESSYISMMLVWGINGFVQSMVWPPMLKLVGIYFSGKEKSKVGVNLSTTVPIGTLVAYGVSLACIKLFGWKSVFLVCGIIVLSVSAFFLLGTIFVENRLKPIALPKDETGNQVKPMAISKLLKFALPSGLLLMLIPIAIHGILKDGVTQWVPLLIAENFQVATDFSLLLTMLLPIVNCTGAYLAKYLNKFIKNEITTSAVFFAVAMLALGVMCAFQGKSLALTIICLAIITNSMFAINVMLITFIPLRFASVGRTSTVSGFFNSIAYVGCGISNFFTGIILSRYSWMATMVMWLAMAIAAILVSLISAKKFKQLKIEE